MFEASQAQALASIDEIARDLLAIVPNGEISLTAIRPSVGIGPSRTFEMPADARGAAEWAEGLNTRGSNLYFTPNTSRKKDARSKELDISHARYVWADCDPDVVTAGDYKSAREHLQKVVLPTVEPLASILIDSGNGYQALFRLAEPMALSTAEAMAEYKEVNAQVGNSFKGGGVHDACRLLRLPATRNYPSPAKLKKGYPAEPSRSRLLASSVLSYTLDELRDLAATVAAPPAALCSSPTPPELATRFAAFLKTNTKAADRCGGDKSGLSDSSGSGMDLSMFGMLRRGGFTKNEIALLLAQWTHGSVNGRSQGARYWDRLDERTRDKPIVLSGPLSVPAGITAAELSAMHFAPLSWVIPGILPEGCYLLTARPKVGKSWLGLQISLAVALGQVTLGQQASKGKAVYLALEDNQRRLQDRLRQLSPQGYATPDLLLFTAWLKFDAGGLDALRELIEQEQPKLVVIDTLAKVRPSATNSHVYENDYKALAPLTELASKNRCCIVVIHHNRKGKSESDALEQISGSLGLVGAVDGALVIDGNRHDQHYRLSLVGRDIPSDDELAIARKANGEWEVLGAAQQVFVSAERKQITDLLVFHPKGLRPKEIADRLGKGQPATRKLLMGMNRDQQVVARAGVYSLPTRTSNSGNGGSSGNTGNGGNASGGTGITVTARHP